jgi:hypothetical protein
LSEKTEPFKFGIKLLLIIKNKFMSENPSELDPTTGELDPITEHDAYLELLEKQLKNAQALPDTPTNQKLIEDLRRKIDDAERNWTPPPPGDC